ncbi:MAG: TonB-dependent receptor [Steroidobacteraceae bacterium]
MTIKTSARGWVWLGALLALPAQAQDTGREAESTTQLQEITVTATKRDELVHKIPYNVTAIGESELRAENITDIKSLIANSVGIDAPQNGARFTDSVTVRGLNISRADANNLEWFTRSTLAYYLDDAPLPFMAYRIKDVARVETLLGPQGTLFGGGALGGAVRYITNQPKIGEMEARISTSFYQTKNGGLSNDTDAMVNLPLGDTVALRISLARLDEKGYTDRYAATPDYLSDSPWTPLPNGSKAVYKDDDWNEVEGGRIALRWQASENFALTLSHIDQTQTAHGTRGAQLVVGFGDPGRYNAPQAFNDHTVLSRYPEYLDRDFRMTTLSLEWDLGFANLTSSTSDFEDIREGEADYLAYGSFFYGTLGFSPFELGNPNWAGETSYISFDNRNSGLLHETRLVSSSDGPLSWVLGVYYADQDRQQQFSEWMPGLEPYKFGGGRTDEGYYENQAGDFTESALFGELSYEVTPKLTLTGGARLFSYEDKSLNRVEDYAFDLVTGTKVDREKKSGESYFKFNASYEITDDFLGYATFSQGFRRGGANNWREGPECFTCGGAISDELRNYKPDTTDNYELGLKGFLLDRRLYLQASLFAIDWHDAQTYFSQDVNFFPVNGTTNGPDARSEGYELQGNVVLGAGFQLSFATNHTEAEWDETKTLCLYANGTSCRTYSKGGKLGGTAKDKYSLGLNWRGSTSGGMDLRASARMRYQGKKQADRGDDPDSVVFAYPSYSTLNLNFGASTDKWDLNVWINNATDEDKVVSFQGTSLIGNITGLRAIYLQPRTVGTTFSYFFR